MGLSDGSIKLYDLTITDVIRHELIDNYLSHIVNLNLESSNLSYIKSFNLIKFLFVVRNNDLIIFNLFSNAYSQQSILNIKLTEFKLN